MNNKRILFFALLMAMSSKGWSQSLTPIDAGLSQTEDMQLSWSLGETFVSTVYGADFVLTEGFHQPIMSVTPPQITKDGIQIDIYPNPTASILNISVNQRPSKHEVIHSEVLDMQGRQVVEKMQIDQSDQQSINLHKLPAGTYVLKISRGNDQQISSHQIIKTK